MKLKSSIDPSVASHSRRVPALDGIRGFAILSVVLFHSKFINGGYLGVDVFFVLSGFLITSLLLREWAATGAISLKHFYFRRALRLGPALLAVLIGACLYEILYLPYPGVESIFLRSFYALTYFANWVWAFRPGENPLGSLDPVWSLAIEEQFYLLWPVTLLWMLSSRLKPAAVGSILFIMVLVAVARRYFLLQAGAHNFRLYAGTDSHADPILIGCFLAVFVRWIPKCPLDILKPWIAATAPVAIVGLIAMMLFSNLGEYSVFQSTWAAIFTGILILTVTVAPSWPALVVFEFCALTWLGTVSYGLYLWHSVATLYLVKHGLVTSRVLQIAIGLTLAYVSYYLLERPCLRLKERFSTE